ncbi:hypothetical protein DFH06DRAFT_1145846 [Mycena polygramma]|nr:hypothetical protein DFH06DRAFT_1145846 [Mycena polygramma]
MYSYGVRSLGNMNIDQTVEELSFKSGRRYEELYIVAVKTLYSEPSGITDGKVMASPAGWRTCFGVINTTVCRTQNGDPAPLDAFQPPDLAPGWIRIDRRREGLDAGPAEMIRATPAPPPITDTAAQTLYKVSTADFTQFYGAQLYTNFGFQTFYTKFFRQKAGSIPGYEDERELWIMLSNWQLYKPNNINVEHPPAQCELVDACAGGQIVEQVQVQEQDTTCNSE